MTKLLKTIFLSVFCLTLVFSLFACANNGGDDSTASNSTNIPSSDGDSSGDSSGQEGQGSTLHIDSDAITVLFQGDSITDNSRSRKDLTDLGGGYAAMVADALNATYGDKIDFTFINRANSGWNLLENWNGITENPNETKSDYQTEFYQYNADIATILIGYNDIMDHYPEPVSDTVYESCYRELLQGLKDRGTVAVCMAAFDIVGYGTEFEAKRTIVKNLAEEFGFPYIDMKPYMMQAVEDGAYKMELFGDLTHPWAAGCRIISELVVDKISALIDEDYVTPSDLGKWKPVTATPDNDQDLTNMRPFLHCANGRIEYDTENFYNTSDFVSTQSLKAVHENKNPYHVNAYTRVLFDLSDLGAINLTQGVLKFDIKLDNFVPWVSVQAYNEINRNNRMYQSPEYGADFSDTNKATPLTDGWYRITIDLSQWAASDSGDILSNVKAIVFTASKGEDADARERKGVDGDKESIMWIDNLTVDGNPIAIYSFDEKTSNMSLIINAKKATDIITFKYKKHTEGKISFAILPSIGDNEHDWNNYLGYIEIGSESEFNMNGVTLTADEDGWYKVSIDLQSVTAFVGDETILNGYTGFGVLYFGHNNTATFDIKELIIEKKQN